MKKGHLESGWMLDEGGNVGAEEVGRLSLLVIPDGSLARQKSAWPHIVYENRTAYRGSGAPRRCNLNILYNASLALKEGG